jgi:hypothetical protein
MNKDMRIWTGFTLALVNMVFKLLIPKEDGDLLSSSTFGFQGGLGSMHLVITRTNYNVQCRRNAMK